ncbi:MAG: ABC transporter permease [Clostridia bacterium]|nr:ABC transporter permease [Clostridia bacterium]
MEGLIASAARELRVVGAVFRQRALTSLRYPVDFVAQTLIGPIAWLVPAYFLGRAFAPAGDAAGMRALTGSGDYVTYLLVGGIVTSFVSSVLWGMGYALKTQMDQGVLEANWLAPASRFSQLVGLSAFNVAYTAAQVVIQLGLASVIFGFHPTGSLALALGFLLPVVLGLYGFGFAFAGVTLLMRDPNTLIDISDFALGLLSGGQFPVAVLPPLILGLALLLPTTYAIDGLRGILMHTHTIAPIGVEFLALSVLAGALLAFGRFAFLRIERFCRERGTIGLR